MVSKSNLKFLFFLFILFSFFACGDENIKEKSDSSYSEIKDSSPEMKDFMLANDYYLKRNFISALAKFQGFLEAYPDHKLADEAAYKIAKIYFVQKKWTEAISAFQSLGQRTVSDAYQAKAQLMSAYAAYKKGDLLLTEEYLNQCRAEFLPTKLQLRYFSLIYLALKDDNQKKSTQALLSLADLYLSSSDSSLRKIKAEDLLSYADVYSNLKTWVSIPMTADELPLWIKDYDGGPSKAYTLFKLAKVYIDSEKNEEARDVLTQFLASFPKHPFASTARKYILALGGEIPKADIFSKNIRVGVILPLTGTRATYGQETLNGLRCAVGEEGCRPFLKTYLKNDIGLELIVKNSGSDTERVKRLVGELAAEGVSAIVGPMSAPLALEAAKKAEALQLPLFPLTQKSDLMKLGSSVFQMGYPAELQIRDLIMTAMSRGLKDFAIFYPKSTYGEAMHHFFTEQASQLGARVVSEVKYNPTSKNLSTLAKKLKLGVSRVSYGNAEKAFDALFIPDGSSIMPRMVPELKEAGIEGVPLLGTQAWNDNSLIESVGLEFPGSFFIDLYDPQEKSDLNQAFADDYRRVYGKLPQSLAALAFDAIGFIAQAYQESGSKDQRQIREALYQIQEFQSITGLRSFTQGELPRIQGVPLVIKADGISSGF